MSRRGQHSPLTDGEREPQASKVLPAITSVSQGHFSPKGRWLGHTRVSNCITIPPRTAFSLPDPTHIHTDTVLSLCPFLQNSGPALPLHSCMHTSHTHMPIAHTLVSYLGPCAPTTLGGHLPTAH